jgi:peptidoglycan-associated lipoprotein
MKTTFRLTLTILIAAALLFAPACRSRRQPTPATTPANTSTVPDVPPPPANTDTRVEQPDDFVRETPTPAEEVMPSDIEALNRYVQERGHIRDAFFNYDESTLDDAAQTALTASARWLKGEGAAYSVLIEGHCDERGTEQYNLALGDRRANTAREYLVTLGVDGRRIRTVSYGEERPFEEGHDDNSWAQNRRAHLVLVR